LWCYIALPPLVFTVEAGWYTVVALCFSSERSRALYMSMEDMGRSAAAVPSRPRIPLDLHAHKTGV